jgi:hypothetical protein
LLVSSFHEIRAAELTELGDSGAVILRKSDSKAVALAFAKDDDNNWTFANPLDDLPWKPGDPPSMDRFPHFEQTGPICV